MSNLAPFDGIHYVQVETRPLISGQNGKPAAADHTNAEARIIQEKLQRMPFWGVIFNVALFMAIPYSVPATVSNAGNIIYFKAFPDSEPNLSARE